MKKLLLLLLVTGSLTSSNLFANNNNGIGARKDTFSIKCLLFSPNAFYAAELGETPLKNTVDSLAGTITYDTTQNLNLVVVSAADLGLQSLADVQWDELLDSAISHGYQPCPAQIGPELYLLSQCVKLHNMPTNVPVFIGMQEITPKKHKFVGISLKKEESFIFCLKSKDHGKSYKLGYASTQLGNKSFIWSAEDKFVFVKGK